MPDLSSSVASAASPISVRMRRRPLRYIFRRFHSLSAGQWRHLATAIWLVPTVRVALSLFPFKKILAYVESVEPSGRVATITYREHASWAISLIARYMLGDKPCLTQAIALQILLQRRTHPSELKIGVKRDDNGKLAAHAWLECGNQVVIGGADSPTKYALLQRPDQFESPMAGV